MSVEKPRKIFFRICQIITFAPIANQNLFKMKKLLLPVALVAFVFAGTSCAKDYTCTCEVFGISSTVEYEGLSKSEADDAEAACTSSSVCTWAEA